MLGAPLVPLSFSFAEGIAAAPGIALTPGMQQLGQGWKSWEGLEPAGGSSLLLTRLPKTGQTCDHRSLVLQESRAGSLHIPLLAMLEHPMWEFVPGPQIPDAVLPLGEQLQSFSPAPGLQHQRHKGAGVVPKPPAFQRSSSSSPSPCMHCRVLPAPSPLVLLLQPRPCKKRVGGDKVSPTRLSWGRGPTATTPSRHRKDPGAPLSQRGSGPGRVKALGAAGRCSCGRDSRVRSRTAAWGWPRAPAAKAGRGEAEG